MKRLQSCRHGFMALNPQLIERRVKSAREFAGLSQKELGARMKNDGFGLHDIGKWERQDPTAPPLSPARIDSLARHTGLPPAWFTEPDTVKLFGRPREDQFVTREEMNALKRELQAKLGDLPEAPDEDEGE